MTLTPPMPYSGGKQRLADKIVALMPEHTVYVEPFAGALSVLLAKRPAEVEVVNDIDDRIVSFWRVLRDRPDDLERVCALTPHSRSEMLHARDHARDCDDELERARRVWVALTQSRGANLNRSGFRFVHGTNRIPLARYLDGYVARIAPAADRLRNVTVECRDAFDVIATYARAGALLYVDPPYLGETRHGRQYTHELAGRADHERLLDQLDASPSLVMVSGYASDLYDTRLAHWHRTELQGLAMTGEPRTEVVWTNFEPANTHPVLDFEGAS